MDVNNSKFSVGADGALYTDKGTTLALYPLGTLGESGSYKAPEGVTKIGPGALRGAGAKLTSVDLRGMTEIGEWAFAGDHIVNLSIPQTVKKVGVAAFSWCSKLRIVMFDGQELYLSAFQHLHDLSSFTIGENVTSVVQGSLGVDSGSSPVSESINFYYNAKKATVSSGFLKYADLPDSCGITLHIGASVEEIPAGAFRGIVNGKKHYLKAVVFDAGASCTVGAGAFAQNSDLALVDASQAESLTFEKGEIGAFNSIASNAKVYARADFVSAFEQAGVPKDGIVVTEKGTVSFDGAESDYRLAVGDTSTYTYQTNCKTDPILTTSDDTVATAEIKDKAVIVTGIAPGKCDIEVSYPVGDGISSASALITVTVIKRTEINVDLGCAPDGELAVTYGDVPVEVPYSVTDDVGISAKSSNESVAFANIEDGKVSLTVKGTGEATVTLSFDGDQEHSSASTSFKVKVSQRQLTITPKDKGCYVGDALPELGEDDFTVDGLAGGDALTAKPKLAYAEGASSENAGTFAITASDAKAGANYEVVYKQGTLTVSDRPVTPPSDTTTETVTNADGSVTVTVTDKAAGTVTVTRTYEDGVVVRTVKARGSEPKVSVTVPASVRSATVSVPVGPTEGTVAVDARIGRVVNRCVPTDDGLDVGVTGSCELVVRDNARVFSDMAGHWAQASVDFASARGLMNGIGDTGAFGPEAMTSRAMVCAVLSNLEYGPEAAGAPSFSDTAGDAWYAKAVAWASETGIVHGYGDGSAFGPDDDVTREQMACMVFNYARAMGVDTSGRADLSGYEDASKLTYGREAMEWCVASGIFHGYDGQASLGGTDGLTRAQCAAVLTNLVTLIVEG